VLFPKLHRVEIFVASLFVALAVLVGCVSHPSKNATSPPVTKPTPAHREYHGPGGGAPTSLKKTDTALEVYILASILFVGVAAGLYFYTPPFIPDAHAASFGIGAGAGAVLILSLILKTSLWLIPWLSAGAIAAAVVLFVYELIKKLGPAVGNSVGEGGK
jgi:hypothetical protein